MSTTFGGDFNALMSPETAPLDEVILGQFNGRGELYLTIWDHESETWTVPQVNLTGWLPLNALRFGGISS